MEHLSPGPDHRRKARFRPIRAGLPLHSDPFRKGRGGGRKKKGEKKGGGPGRFRLAQRADRKGRRRGGTRLAASIARNSFNACAPEEKERKEKGRGLEIVFLLQ